MSTSDPCRLLELSAELRLDIYLHLVVACLAEGTPAALAGLFLSCREIQRELQAEFGLKIHPLLRAQTEWNKQSRGDAEARRMPVRLQLAHQLLTPDARPANLTVVLPILSSWLFNTSAWALEGHSLEDKPLFMSLVATLYPILSLPWSVLTLNFCKMAYAPKISFNLTRAVAEGFFWCLMRVPNSGTCVFGQVDRLVLNYGSGRDGVSEGHFQALFEDFFSFWRIAAASHGMPVRVRGWIARVKEGRQDEQGWKVAFDLKDGLQRLEGALWGIAREGELWKAERLFDGDMDEVLAGERWEREYDTDGKERGSSGSESEGGEDEHEEDTDEELEDGVEEDM